MQHQVLRPTACTQLGSAKAAPPRTQSCAAAQWRTRPPVSLRRRRRGACPAVCMGIKAVESYDGAFQLADASEQQLKALLSSPAFCAQVVKQCSLPETAAVAFADVLFQPVPWSPTTRKGMPQEFERYHGSPEFAIINVPPNFMFQAKIFKPSRLCAVYHVTNH